MCKNSRLLITSLVLLFIYITVCFTPNIENYTDNIFLYNRAVQILDCLEAKTYPYYYFDDFGGLGYGSSFFYGQLTLFPFIPFVKYGISVFLKVYLLATLLVNFLGVSLFTKRFTKNSNIIALLYITSSLYSMMHINTNKLGVGLSFIFLAFCIDFFRDDKNFIPASLMFVLVFNTHLITSLLSVVICVMIMIYYFNSKNLLKYLAFCINTVLLCLYNIVNMLWHYMDFNLNSSYLVDLFSSNSSNYCIQPFIFSDFISRVILKNFNYNGVSYCSFLVIFIGLILFIKSKSYIKKKELLLIILSIFLTILGLQPIWSIFYKYTNIVIQYPIRYMPYILVFWLIILLRKSDTKVVYIILIVPILSLMLPEYSLTDSSNLSYMDCQIMGGEYLDSSFIRTEENIKNHSGRVISDKGDIVSYTELDNKLYIDLPKDNNYKNILVPKLYYKGMSNNMGFDTYKGFSQFTQIDINNWSGILVVSYNQPILLIFIQYFSSILFLFSILFLIEDKFFSK